MRIYDRFLNMMFAFMTGVLLLPLSTMVYGAGYSAPDNVSIEQAQRDIRRFMGRPDIPLNGDQGWVEDIIRIRSVGMDWDIGMSVHEPVDPARVPVGPDGKKIGLFFLHGGSGDFKSMHRQAGLIAGKLGYKVVSMSYPGRHAFHTPGRDWPGRNVTAYDHHKYSLEVRTPIWLRGEHITPDQYDVIKDYSQRPRYGIRTLARAKPGTTFYYRMAGWPMAFEQAGITAMLKHFPEDEYTIYVHGHSTGGPFVNMLSQRVPNVAGILALESSPFGYVSRARSAWGGQLGKIDGFNQVTDEDIRLEPRADPFDELYLRSWRDSARYAGPELLGQEGPAALMRLPMIMEDILDDWGDVQKRASFKAEYIIHHGIKDSLTDAAMVTAKRLGLNEADTGELIEHYIGLTRELSRSGVKPVPPVMFQISAHSRDHSRDVYEQVIVPMYHAMDPAPKTALTQFHVGTHGYMNGKVVEAYNVGFGPAVFQQWHDAIMGGWFQVD